MNSEKVKGINNDAAAKPNFLDTLMTTLINILNKLYINIKSHSFALLFLIVALWTLPWPAVRPGVGLDASWINALNISLMDHLQFGKDVVFMYGPLGFLILPVTMDYNLWRISLVFSLFIHFLLFASIYVLLSKLSAKWYHYLLMAMILIFENSYPDPLIPFIDDIIPLIVSIIIFIVLINEKPGYKDYIYLTLASFLIAVATLLKFNAFIECVFFLGISFVAFILIKKNLKYSIFTIVCSLLFFTCLWMASGQNFSNIPGYIQGGFEISNGYTAAMSLQGPDIFVIPGFIVLFALTIIFGYSIIKRKNILLLFLLMNSIIFFSAFKHGYVRADGGHIMIFQQSYLLLFGITLVLLQVKLSKDSTRIYDLFVILLTLTMLIGLLISFIVLSHWSYSNSILTKYPSYQATADMLLDESTFNHQYQNYTDSIKEIYQLDNKTIEYIDNKTVDLFPWNISICQAYGFNWSPRLTFQSCSDYSQYLDNITSEHFAGNDSPQVILYGYGSIDGRYPAADEPATFGEIIDHYDYVSASGDYLILNKTDVINIHPDDVDLGTSEVKIGQKISVPDYNGLVFGKVNIDYSARGKIANLLYKPSNAYIQFELKNGTKSNIYRVIPGVIGNGVLVSDYIDSTSDLIPVIQGRAPNDIDGIYIYTDDKNDYYDSVKVNFIGVPFNNSTSR